MPAETAPVSRIETSEGAPRKGASRRTWLLLIILLLVSFGHLILLPWFLHVQKWRRFTRLLTLIRTSINAFRARRPADVPEAQWEEAVSWTANVVVQDFFTPNDTEYPGLVRLSSGLEERLKGPVDLTTLQWVWDQCAEACGGPQSFGIRFRDVKLLTKGPITDANLADVWSVTRLTRLDLSFTEISDASIPFLSSLQHLEYLDIHGTQITEQGIEQLRRAIPKCEFRH